MDKPLTLVEHLGELRKRIIISLLALGIATTCNFTFAESLLRILKLPASGLIEKLAFFSPQEAFLIYIRIAFFSGLIFSMPVILYQIWTFILPALEKRLKRHAGLFILFCYASFIIGCIFAYFILIPPALKFLLSFGKNELEPVISAQNYISFVIGLILGCGLVFQMPVLSLILTRIGILHHRTLRKKYKYAVVIIFVMAAVVTPTSDAFNMFLLALPMLCLYELSIWISFFAGTKTK
jgi:sec-independent protein translocase protein TatC